MAGRNHPRVMGRIHRQAHFSVGHESQSIGTIAGGIAHEFNNHLTPVRGYLELALDDLSPEHPCYDGLLTALDRCCTLFGVGFTDPELRPKIPACA